jgi:hypothetical protein
MTTLLAVYRFSLQSPGPEGWSLTKSYPGLPLHLQRVSKPPPFIAHCTVPILTLSCLDPMWRKPFYSFCPSFHFPFTTFVFFFWLYYAGNGGFFLFVYASDSRVARDSGWRRSAKIYMSLVD